MVSPFRAQARWIVLVHHVPREPSTVRISLWRRIKALGAAQLADGVVALPEDAHTREQLEWIAQRVEEAGGVSTLMRAETLGDQDHARLVAQLIDARTVEYDALTRRVSNADDLAGAEAVRLLRSARKELHAIQRRDYFPPTARDTAVAAVQDLADRVAGRVVDPPRLGVRS